MTMKHKYEVNRRYKFEATNDSVCPVPDDAEVIIWESDRLAAPTKKASRWTWDDRILHFLVTSYPKTKHKAWVNCYPDGYSCSYRTQVEANGASDERRTKCIEIEWEADNE